MKLILIISSFILVCCSSIYAQNKILNDSKILKSILDDSTMSPQERISFDSIIFSYIDTNDINLIFVDGNVYYNSILKSQFETIYNKSTKPSGREPEFFLSGSGFSGIGSKTTTFSWTNILVGYTDFILDRAQQEISIAFLDKFKSKLENNSNNGYQEIQILLPTITSYIIHDFNPVYLERDLSSIKDFVRADLQNIPNNYPDLLNTSRFQKMMDSFPYLAPIRTLLIEAPKMGKPEYHIADLFGKFKPFEKDTATSLLNSSLLFCRYILEALTKQENIVSTALPNNQFKTVWLSKMETDEVIKSDVLRTIFIGLLYQKLRSIPFDKPISNQKLADLLNKKLKGSSPAFEKNRSIQTDFIEKTTPKILINKVNIDHAHSKVLSILIEVGKVKEMHDQWKNSKTPEDQIKFYSAINNLFFVVVDISKSFEFDNNLSTDFYNRLRNVSNIIRSGLNVSIHIKKKDYSLVIYDLTELIKYAGIDWIHLDKIYKYGLFLTKLYEAETPDEVQALLETVALPVGSSAVKKTNHFNVAIQNYLGVDFGTEWLNSNRRSKFGYTLPVGFAFSWDTKNNRSNTGFINIFNLGALADFRINSEDNVDELAGTKPIQFLSLGAHYVWGMKKAPFSIAAGLDYYPKYREVITNTDSELADVWQVKAQFVLDIPFINIINQPTKNKRK